MAEIEKLRPVGVEAGEGVVERRVPLLYIAGYGRSGTTLLSIALEQHPSIFAAGEIHELTRHAWLENTFCSCGERLQGCAFWTGVMRNWAPTDGRAFIEDYAELQKKFEPIGVMPAGIIGGAGFEKFTSATADLLRLISTASGKDVIIDSSKMPGRAQALAQIADLDLYVVHLVRDGRGVAWSLSKSYARDDKAGLQREIKPKSMLRTSLRWSMVNLATEGLRRTVGDKRYLLVRYEDFVADPAGVLARIGDMIGVDLRSVGAKIAAGDGIRAGHQIAGNRLRLNPSIKVQADESWRSQMPDAKQRLFERLSGWLLRRYRYE